MMLSTRYFAPELMDDPALSAQELNIVLRDLYRLNRVSFTALTIATEIHSKFKPLGDTLLKLLDVGCGSGETFCDVIKILLQKGVKVEGVGIDSNPISVERGNKFSIKNNLPIIFKQGDAVEASFSEVYDVALSSLFLHHLSEVKVRELFCAIKQKASKGIVMCDLERRSFGFFLALLATRILSRSKIVHHDGPQSVRAAFNKNELIDIATVSDLLDMNITRVFPCQMLLSWRRI